MGEFFDVTLDQYASERGYLTFSRTDRASTSDKAGSSGSERSTQRVRAVFVDADQDDLQAAQPQGRRQKSSNNTRHARSAPPDAEDWPGTRRRQAPPVSTKRNTNAHGTRKRARDLLAEEVDEPPDFPVVRSQENSIIQVYSDAGRPSKRGHASREPMQITNGWTDKRSLRTQAMQARLHEWTKMHLERNATAESSFRAWERQAPGWDNVPGRESCQECKVSSGSDVHLTAGFISKGISSGKPPAVLAISGTAVNQAVKALAVARRYLGDGTPKLDLLIRPFLPQYHEGSGTTMTKFILVVVDDDSVRAHIQNSTLQELKVSSDSYHEKVAASIADHIRTGKQVFLSGMGMLAVVNAVKSIYLAHQYLQRDGFYLSFVPEFGEAYSTDNASRMKFYVLAS